MTADPPLDRNIAHFRHHVDSITLPGCNCHHGLRDPRVHLTGRTAQHLTGKQGVEIWHGDPEHRVLVLPGYLAHTDDVNCAACTAHRAGILADFDELGSDGNDLAELYATAERHHPLTGRYQMLIHIDDAIALGMVED
jgi:hypothetical protein